MQLEKEKAGERPSQKGDWLRVSRGRLKGVVLVEVEAKGGCVGTSTSLLKNGRAGGDGPPDHYR